VLLIKVLALSESEKVIGESFRGSMFSQMPELMRKLRCQAEALGFVVRRR
jgi:hypothetical protein